MPQINESYLSFLSFDFHMEQFDSATDVINESDLSLLGFNFSFPTKSARIFAELYCQMES